MPAMLVPLPTQSDRVEWPTEKWSRAPLDVRVDSAAVDRLLEYAFAQPEALGQTNALIVVQRGQIVAERSVDPSMQHMSWSMAKSVLHAAVGILVGDGRIDALGEGLAFEYGPLEEPGVYRAPIGRRSLAFVANVDRRESDLTCVDEATLLKVIDRPINIVSSAAAMERAASTTPTTELASTLLYLLIGVLFLEMWIALRFGATETVVEPRLGPKAPSRGGSAAVSMAGEIRR